MDKGTPKPSSSTTRRFRSNGVGVKKTPWSKTPNVKSKLGKKRKCFKGYTREQDEAVNRILRPNGGCFINGQKNG